MKPIVDRLENELKGEVIFVSLDATSEYGKKTYRKYGVNQVPTFIAFDSGFNEVIRVRGRVPKSKEILSLVK